MARLLTKHQDTLVLFVVLLAVPAIAHATVLDNFGTAVLNILNNNFLRTIAIIAVIVIGIMALRGSVSWLAFIVVLLGITVIFGAAGIVDYIQQAATTT